MIDFLKVVVVTTLISTARAVLELNDNNFLAYAQTKDVLLVDFYAPWCSDCKRLDPNFENAASELGDRSGDLAKVDCFGTGKGLCEMYGVKSWPQLKNFNRGTYTGDYTGMQTAEAMAAYINTVESSAYPQPAGNPYAMAFPTAPAAPVASYVPAPKDPLVEPAPPVVGDVSCARCTIGRVSKCTKVVKKACVELKLREKAKEEERRLNDDDKKRTNINLKKSIKKSKS